MADYDVYDVGYDPDLESPDEYLDYELEEEFDQIFEKAKDNNDKEAMLGVGIVTIMTGYIVDSNLSSLDKKKLTEVVKTQKTGGYIRDSQLLKMLRLEKPTVTMNIPKVIIPPQDLIRVNQIYGETRAYNLINNPGNIENLAYRNAQMISEKTGIYGMIEAEKEGELHVYQNVYVKILIPWETAGDDKVCLDCQDLADNGPYPPEDYPEPPHWGCRCEPGEPIFETV